MIQPLDEIPGYIEGKVRDRIAAGADRSTLLVDESEEEFLVAYTDFTDTLKEKYQEACNERGEEHIKVYQIQIDNSGVQLSRYESAKGRNAEEMWRENVQ